MRPGRRGGVFPFLSPVVPPQCPRRRNAPSPAPDGPPRGGVGTSRPQSRRREKDGGRERDRAGRGRRRPPAGPWENPPRSTAAEWALRRPSRRWRRSSAEGKNAMKRSLSTQNIELDRDPRRREENLTRQIYRQTRDQEEVGGVEGAPTGEEQAHLRKSWRSAGTKRDSSSAASVEARCGEKGSRGPASGHTSEGGGDSEEIRPVVEYEEEVGATWLLWEIGAPPWPLDRQCRVVLNDVSRGVVGCPIAEKPVRQMKMRLLKQTS